MFFNNGKERKNKGGRERERKEGVCARTCACVRDGVGFTNGKSAVTFSQTFYTCGFHSPLRPCDWFGLYESVV